MLKKQTHGGGGNILINVMTHRIVLQGSLAESVTVASPLLHAAPSLLEQCSV